jgi:drug/metabolite transporter (DMT)-like permease
VLVALVVPLLWAVTDILIAARGGPETLDPIAGLGVMYVLSAVLTLPMAMLQGQLFMIGPELGWAFWVLLLNAVVDMANYLLYVLLIGIAGAVFGSQSAYVSTLAGIFWSMMLLGEVLTGAAASAFGLILVGLVVVGPKSEAADLEVQFVPRAKRRGRRRALPWA